MVKEIISYLPPKEKVRGVLTILSTLLVALTEFIGVALFVPLLYLLLDPKNIHTIGFLNRLYQFSALPSTASFILLICSLLMLLFVVKNILSYRLTIFQSKYLIALYRFFTVRLFSDYYNQGVLFVKGQNSNNLAYHVNYISYVFVFSILSNIIRLASEILLLLLLSMTIVSINYKVFLLLLILFVPALFIYNYLIKGRLADIGRIENKSRKSQSRIVYEVFRGYTEVEVNQAFPLLLDNFTSELDTLSDCKLKSIKISGQWERILELGVISGLLIVLLYNTFGANQEGSGLMIFTLLSISLVRLMPTVKNILACINQIKNNLYVWDIVSEIYQNKEVEQISDSEESLSFKENIVLEDLHFGFQPGKEILHGINLTISKGERIAFKGLSGSGKTTLFHLILGLYPPQKGSVKIDGVALTPANRFAWHKMVGYVSQDVFILDGSLALNIALGINYDKIDYHRLDEVISQAGLTDFLRNLPEGFQSRLGEGGSKISGGERQRIGIARALYHNVSVLLMDEATSAIDVVTEQNVNDSLRQLIRNQPDLTILLIAHRGSTLEFCDRVVELRVNEGG